MKKFLFSLGIMAVLGISATAQTKTKHPTKEEADKWLPGIWVVENRDLLPIIETGQTEYMRDTLKFLPGKAFKNGSNIKSASTMYEYNQEAGVLVILNVANIEGIEYEVDELTENKLSVLVLNRTKTSFVELVYKRHAEKAGN